MVTMENQQTGVVAPQPAEAETKVGKKPRIFWVGLDLVALLFWLYAIIKVFVFDLDVYFVSRASSEFVWLLNYKLLILLGLILIAMLVTRSTVEQRAREISGATGVAVPFGVRRCWRVMTPSKAEQLVHDALSASRLRNDREFFRIDFVGAAKIISATLQIHEMELRTLDNLAALSA